MGEARWSGTRSPARLTWDAARTKDMAGVNGGIWNCRIELRIAGTGRWQRDAVDGSVVAGGG